MKIPVCDVCYSPRFGKKLTLRTHRISFSDRKTFQKIALDVCPDHLEFFKKDCKTFADAVNKAASLQREE